ncbi:MAG: polyprenyl synthetase family protein [Planctomycetota bacterium]
MSPLHDKVAAIIEMIHVATLVHDDILDGALVRRSLPSLNAIHGHEVSVLLGDYIYAKAFHMSVSMPDQRCSRLLAEVTRVICQGEITQMLHRYDLDTTEDLYLRVIGEKTAVLYGASGELGAAYAGGTPDQVEACRRFGHALGTAFQIIDDCLDVEGEEAVVGKSLGTDFGKGKLTLPFLHLYAGLGAGDRRRFEEIFADPGLEDRQAVLAGRFDLSEGLRYAHDRADAFLHEALAALGNLPASAYLEALRTMTDYVLERRR